MEIITKRTSRPALSGTEEHVLEHYERRLRTEEDLTAVTIRNYLSDLLKPNSVNRSRISLKRYFAWVLSTGQMKHDPAKAVKLVGEEVTSPRHLDDQAEQALVATVTGMGSLRDRAIIVLMCFSLRRDRHN